MIELLQNWYRGQCDGEWEHALGVTIESLDNPGWSVKVDLAGTRHACAPELLCEAHFGEEDWLVCRINDNQQFEGFGGPRKLTDILAQFEQFVRRSGQD